MSLLRNFATVGGATLSSRVLGFVRDVLIAAVLGTGAVADAYFVAFRFPNLFRRLFAEGAFNSAFIPLFARALEGEGRRAARKFAEEALSGLVLVLLLVIAVAEIAMPVLMYVLAPGFIADAGKFDLAVLLTRIAFPYLLFVSVLALLSGVLNGLRRFAAAAFAPTLLNVVLIAALVAIEAAGLDASPDAGFWLCWAVLVGGIAQLVMVIIALKRTGFRLGFRRPRMTPGMRRLVELGIPGVISGGITQINILVGTMIASLQAGAVSYLYYADRIYQLPLGVVGIAIGVVLLPELARRLKAGDIEAAERQQNRSLEFAMVLTLPAAIALMVIAGPVIQVLFERGAFTAEDTRASAAALAGFGLGLPAFVLIKVFSPGFFAREDTRTPMYFAAAGVAVNIAGSLALFPFFGHVGIAVATSLAGWVNAGLLFATLRQRGQWRSDAALRRRLPRILLASAIMGSLVYGLAVLVAPMFAAGSAFSGQVLALAGIIVAGMAAFFAIAQAIGGTDLAVIRDALRRG